MSRHLIAAIVFFVMLRAATTPAQPTLRGVVLDADTQTPVAGVRVTLDSLFVRTTASDGSFDFGLPSEGSHVLVFEHITYERQAARLRWPQAQLPLVFELHPRSFVVEPIDVTAERTLPALPVSSVSFNREATTFSPGNIANDPLRTLQSHPSATTAGIDFLSTMAVRGGNTEEHRVYFDDYPLRHYAHVGGFSSIVYDDMLESTLLVPGAAPIRYKGSLSGTIMLVPERPDTSSISLRYDITSIAGGITHVGGSSLLLQASAKSDFFNLPVYQQLGVETRSFKDLMARAVASPSRNVTVTPTFLLARDSEVGTAVDGVAQTRETSSVLAGVDLSYRPSDWQVRLRPHYSYYESRDALTWSLGAREHRLDEVRAFAEVARQGTVVGFGVSGELGVIRHTGTGIDMSDVLYSLAAELRWLFGETVALALGAGGSREEWTSTVEPEAYASVRTNLGEHVTLSGAYRRSHQSLFLFSERRYFAAIPIDPGDLAAGYAPSSDDARAVRMDQASVEATVELPFDASIEGNGFWRWYDNLLKWDWTNFPTPERVRGGGTGRGHGFEVAVARQDPDFLSLMASASRARVWRREGTLAEERVGDFDKPDAWQVGGSLRISESVRLSVRYVDVAGHPVTEYDHQTTPPPDEQVNAATLPRFRRLDAKLTVQTGDESFQAIFFIDVVNVLNRLNIATTYALEVNPGEFVSVPYGGTRFFPIGGITIRW